MTTHTTATTPTPSPTTGTGSTGSSGRTIYPLLWLRGLAAVLVMTFHAYQHNRGPQGEWPLGGVVHQSLMGTDLFVDMFFVLSAFVLWLPVARTVLSGETGRPGWLMLLRRMGRLLPLYLTVVLVVWAVTNPSLPGHWQDLALHLTFTHVYSDEYIFWTNGPAWSLAVEFHFYVLLALLIPVVRRASQRFTSHGQRLALALAPAALCLVAGASYLAWQVWVAQPSHENWSAWFNPLAKAPDFAVGMALAVLSAVGVRLGARARVATGALGVAALFALAFSRPLEGLVTNWWHLGYAACVAVAISPIVLHDGPHPAWMSWKPVAWVGGLGYGIYLIHEPVMRFLGFAGVLPEPRPGLAFLWTAALVAAVTITLAWVSSRTVEASGLKVLNLFDRQGRPRDYYAHLSPATRA